MVEGAAVVVEALEEPVASAVSVAAEVSVAAAVSVTAEVSGTTVSVAASVAYTETVKTESRTATTMNMAIAPNFLFISLFPRYFDSL